MSKNVAYCLYVKTISVIRISAMADAKIFDFENMIAQACTTTRNLVYHFYDIKPKNEEARFTALLLHGHGDLSFGWRNVIPTLQAHGIRCIVPDLLGFGNSSKPLQKEAYRMKLMAQDMLELLRSAGVDDHEKVRR